MKTKDYTVSLKFGVIECQNETEAKQQFLEVIKRGDYTENSWTITCWDCYHGKHITGKCQMHDTKLCEGCGEALLENEAVVESDRRHATCC